MENITIGQIAVALAFLAALIAGGVKIKDAVKKWLESLLKEKFDESKRENERILTEISGLKQDLKKVDLENCKNYLVTFLAEVERGEVKDAIELQRFWEEYERYAAKGGNSYIKEKVQKLKAKNWL